MSPSAKWRSLSFGFALLLGVLSLLFAGIDTTAQDSDRKINTHFKPPNSLPESHRQSRSTDDLEEKIACLGTNPSVPRLGIKGSGHVEGIHGLTQGGPGKWGSPMTIPTTTFPQGIGLGKRGTLILLRRLRTSKATKHATSFKAKYHQGGIVIRSPNADLGRDPRWGRTEECYGEDPFFNGTMVVAFVKGLQGNDPKYWLSAALMKHFLATIATRTIAIRHRRTSMYVIFP